MVFGRRYRVTEKIGAGGMAEVYKAVDETLGRTVAVKVMHPRYAADETFAARFRQEAQAAANLQSPYIVNIYDWGQDGSTYYIVMEYVRGTDLKSVIEQRGALDSRRVADIGAQVCSALSVAHGYDVIHRDIKPHNIMVAPDGSVKVMDFGIARAGNSTMTQTGSVLGTAHYVSPEQAQGKPLNSASDLYSLGVVLYEASTGRLPFDAETPVAVALKQVNEEPVPPHQINPRIDPSLEAIIMKAMAKTTAVRYDTAQSMKRDLVKVVQGQSVTPAAGAAVGAGMADQTAVLPAVGAATAPQQRQVRKRQPVWPWILLAALLIAAGLGVAYAMGLFNQGIPVPKVVGMPVNQAETALTEQGFVVGDISEKFDKAEKGTVLDQSPVANAPAEKGSAVDLVVSKGPELVEVPTILGLEESEAKAKLEELGFVASPLPDEPSQNVAAGKVFRQDPPAGQKAEKGTLVRYVVSRGPDLVQVPDVEGDKSGSAKSQLTEAGFKVQIVEAPSDSVASGRVISQNPAAGLKVQAGSTVVLTVSTGPELVALPDTVGSDMNTATAQLEALGMEVSIEYEPHQSTGLVLDQNPKAGTKVKRGSTVTLTVDGETP